MSSISVAMAVYNGEMFIREQLDSIVSQLENSDELVISYDKSTDSTYDIICEYADKYPQVKVISNPGSGVFDNFENAISNCNCDYIFISDQDDIWVDGKRNRIVEDFEMTKSDMIIHNGIHIDTNGKRITKDFFTLYHIKKGLIRNFARPRYSGCCMAFRKELKPLLIPIPRSIGAYDHWLGMVGEVYGKVYFEQGVYLKHRLHGKNVTVNTRNIITIMRVRWHILIELVKLRRKAKALMELV